MANLDLSALGAILAAPAGLGSAAPQSPLLADNIDPATMDFADLFEGSDVVDAQVALALSVFRGSGASVFNDGIDPPPRKMLDSLERELKDGAMLALRRLVASGDIEVSDVTVSVDESNSGAQTSIEYRNLRALDAFRTRTQRVLLRAPKLS